MASLAGEGNRLVIFALQFLCVSVCVFTTCTVETHTDAESVAKRTSRKEVEPRDDPREKKSALADATGVWIVVV